MSGERDLAALLAGARPLLAHPAVVLVSVPDAADLPALATVVEDEGVTAVLRREDADARALPYDWVGSWITLRVHSALEAVGLTAAFSAALTGAGISCNVLAGFHHDHILVPADRAEEALALLGSLGGPT